MEPPPGTGNSTDQGSESLSGKQEPQTSATLRMRVRDWRNRMISNPDFRRVVARIPLVRRLAARNANDLFRTVSGFVHSQILFAFVEAGLHHHLARGALPLNRLRAECGLPETALKSLLETGASIGLVTEIADGIWALDDPGAVIAGEPGIAAMIRHHAMLYHDLADPLARLGNPGGDTRTARFWRYAGARDPQVPEAEADAYSGLMAASQAMIASEILALHDFARHVRIADIGGGHGAFLEAVGNAHRKPQLALFDLPPVVAEARRRIAATPLAARFEYTSGSFFTDPLPGSCDCYTLVRVLCDHDDANAMLLLRNLHRAMPRGATLLIGEAMADGSQGGKLAHAYFSLYFAAMGAGRCRTPARIAAMLHEAGFAASRFRPGATSVTASLVVATA